MKEVILDVLNKYTSITKIKDVSDKKRYGGKLYQYIYKFSIEIDELNIPIIMGIPLNWDRELIDVYIENYKELTYIPHVNNKGFICLFDLEGVLIEVNFEGLLNQTLQRVKQVLYDGLFYLNKEDFIEEFEQYWGRLPNSIILRSMINITDNIKVIKYTDDRNKRRKQKHEKYIDYLKKQRKYSLIASDCEENFKMYNNLNTVKNGIYIYIKTEEYIYPPDFRNKLDIDYINKLLNHGFIDKEKLKNRIKQCKGDLLLIFNIKQPNNCNNILGAMIKGSNINNLSQNLIIQTYFEVNPCWVLKCDKEFLINRGGASSDINNKRLLVIGCGSIGGYLINELVNAGINNITMIDNDILKEENIYRHLIGMEYINQYKTIAIAEFINKNIPDIDIRTVEEKIEDAIDDGSISLSEYDLIISAIGNHNVNRRINNYMHKCKLDTPVIYLWNEILGIGSHGAFITTKYKGCYECFFGETEEGIYDKTSYCERGQVFTKKVRGCGSSFLPFGSIHSLATVTIGIELVKNYFLNPFKENCLISLKGDNYYLKKEGFKTSNRYNTQKQYRVEIVGSQFFKSKCLCCGGK
ncbi:ThiF family adenylyltransferase [Clostridium sporogenes]|uniref:ThiF family adenylyltransferase n=1 Tax=Clostridium sporogenes TaxID=1509 RepID=UPI0006B2A37E|nr:ThiF family adenylyltransferase [Clostridium sporogenes]KOY65397.1 hypothetical protein AN649_13025 [Clostridium sporogenes]MDS1006674.1 ThiF family adenylyltransferase [Clostridium sporogenes]